jgi:zinc/manganese transport system substrate-binding protein
MNRRAILAFGLAALVAGPAASALAKPALKVVAAENFYGDVARQIGGDQVAVASILSNPNQDPHQFEASASTARALADAELVIYSGADYDPWVAKLLSVPHPRARTVIVAADLVGAKSGDNPHIWYEPKTMPAVARAIASALGRLDPAHSADYDRRRDVFLASMTKIDAQVAALRAKYNGTPVTATEPVFGYMAAALGFDMRNGRFQIAVMNDTEPSARDLAAFESDLRERKVAILFYNSQVTDELTTRLLNLAHQAKVPVVGVTETQPVGKTYQQWMTASLDAVDKALAGRAP